MSICAWVGNERSSFLFFDSFHTIVSLYLFLTYFVYSLCNDFQERLIQFQINTKPSLFGSYLCERSLKQYVFFMIKNKCILIHLTIFPSYTWTIMMKIWLSISLTHRIPSRMVIALTHIRQLNNSRTKGHLFYSSPYSHYESKQRESESRRNSWYRIIPARARALQGLRSLALAWDPREK